MSILVTGGTGYIGSHTSVELIKQGYDIVIADNLSNSKADVIDKIEKITGKRPAFYQVDILDRAGLENIFSAHNIDAIIHFAGKKAVGESVQQPLMYYHNNITGTINVLEAMLKFGCRKFVFSSSATVYGVPKTVPIKEDFPLSATNPYGSTKLYIEGILKDLYVANPSLSITLLRYFNPIGAHESGLIGDNPNGIPNNLMPYITRVAKGTLPYLNVFGNDYPTHDGTGVRDYIHVIDLARGHIKAIEHMDQPGVKVYNLGTGKGYSVLDIVHAFEKVNGIKIPYQFTARRPGDVAECYADPTKAKEELGWTAEYGLEEMCRSAWNFEKNQ
ncbi:MAG TPA: UDP-glucose 4-epimerase GalE [Bacillota bacterium]|mgnify:FL=1|nr:UDP-glucose 4-epimerase GalE [Bacillota bacterium]HOK69071.1 UDP-glucose 4-epimerase GalE [Bacillota bacterium]HPP85094.1 UDP-glucose 4-epimerase GalE [Bacillota bacterium]